MHALTAGQGAVFGSRNGWERPNVFAPEGIEPRLDYSWERPVWADWCIAEQRAAHEACRDLRRDVMKSKYLVTGPDAEQALQWVCSADIAVPVGTAVYRVVEPGRWLRGDVTVTRIGSGATSWSAASRRYRDLDWLRRQLPEGLAVEVVDVTSATPCSV